MASKTKDSDKGSTGKKEAKKRQRTEVEDDSSSSSSASESEQSDVSEDEGDLEHEEINVDFEGKEIVKEDFHGIKMLLQQLLLTMSLNISELTDIITAQSSIGSTLKVVEDDEGTVYGVTTIIDLEKNQGKESIKKLENGLRDKCKHSSSEKLRKLEKCLESSTCLLLNERFINIPEDVAVPMFAALRSEIEEGKKQGRLSNFEYILFVTKSVRPTKDLSQNNEEAGTGSSSNPAKKKKKRRKSDQLETKDEKVEQLQFINPEDELFYKNSAVSFNYCVTNATGFAVSGEWEFSDVAMDTYRTVVVVEFSKLDQIIKRMETLYS